jgi:nicotinamidase/pyrazinamidase
MGHYDESTALIVVDIQNDFADSAGSLYVPGGEAVIDLANAEIEKALAAGACVVYTQDWHPPHTPHFAQDGGIWPVHCVADTWGSELAPGLRIEGDVIRKGTAGEDGYSGFAVRDPESGAVSSTGLAEMLADRGVERVVVVGLALDYCVKETARDGIGAGFATTLLQHATRAVNLEPDDGARALQELASAGVELA